MKYLVLLFVCLISPAFTFGQQLIPQDLSVVINPEVPMPNSVTQFKVESFVIDLDRSNMSWTVDGQQKQSSLGGKAFSFTTGSVGTQHKVVLKIDSQDGGTLIREFDINVGQLDLIWEAIDSYTPTVYRGKALNGHESGVKVLALPYFLDKSGRQINPQNLIYTWTVNKKVQAAASGPGRDLSTFIGPSIYRDALVTVDVESSDGIYTARRSVNLKAQQPQVHFYVDEPLLGLLTQSVISGSNIALARDEVVIKAVPFFMSNVRDTRAVEYDWRIDGKEIVTVGDRNQITLRKPEAGSARSVISLELRHIDKLLQFARQTFTATFTEREATTTDSIEEGNFFGL